MSVDDLNELNTPKENGINPKITIYFTKIKIGSLTFLCCLNLCTQIKVVHPNLAHFARAHIFDVNEPKKRSDIVGYFEENIMRSGL